MRRTHLGRRFGGVAVATAPIQNVMRRSGDTSEALVHNTALRDPALLEDPGWVAEVCDMLERYHVRDTPG